MVDLVVVPFQVAVDVLESTETGSNKSALRITLAKQCNSLASNIEVDSYYGTHKFIN